MKNKPKQYSKLVLKAIRLSAIKNRIIPTSKVILISEILQQYDKTRLKNVFYWFYYKYFINLFSYSYIDYRRNIYSGIARIAKLIATIFIMFPI